MKTIKRILIIILFYIPLSVFSQIQSAELTAAGLTCSMCSKAVYAALSKVSFIEKIETDLNRAAFSLQFKPNAHVELDDLKSAVEGAGFSVALLKVKARFNDVKVYNDAHVKLDGIYFHFLNVPEQRLMGEVAITLVDKGFIPSRKHVKYGKYTAYACFETGKRTTCCPQSNDVKTNRIYHITL